MNTKQRHTANGSASAAPSGKERDLTALLKRLQALTRTVMDHYDVENETFYDEDEGQEKEHPLLFTLISQTWEDGSSEWSCGYQFYQGEVAYWLIHDDGGTPLRAAQRLLERLEGKGLCTR